MCIYVGPQVKLMFCCVAACVCVQYLDGPEVDCDLVLSEGNVVYGAITDNWPTVSTSPTSRAAAVLQCFSNSL